MADKIIRVVTCAPDGTLRTKEVPDVEVLVEQHEQIGIDDCSTDLTLRGMPVFRGLIGPIPETATIVRYESPDAFETLTKEWSRKKTKRRRRRTAAEMEAAAASASHANPAIMPPVSMGSPIAAAITAS